MTISRIAPLRAAVSVLTGLLVSAGIFTSGAVASPARASIQAVVLSTKDLTRIYGGGFKAFMNGVISNADLASIEKTTHTSTSSNVLRAGRVTGYESVWFRGSRSSSLSVTNAVNEYRDSGIVAADFGRFGRDMTRVKGVTFHLSPLKGLGDEAFTLTMTSHGSTGHGLVFRRGRYFAEIMVAAQHGTVNLTGLPKLAAIEDQRIQARG